MNLVDVNPVEWELAKDENLTPWSISGQNFDLRNPWDVALLLVNFQLNNSCLFGVFLKEISMEILKFIIKAPVTLHNDNDTITIKKGMKSFAY